MTNQEKLECCDRMIAQFEDKICLGICTVFQSDYPDVSMKSTFPELFNEIFTNLLPARRSTTFLNKTTMYAFEPKDFQSRIEFLETFKKQFE